MHASFWSDLFSVPQTRRMLCRHLETFACQTAAVFQRPESSFVAPIWINGVLIVTFTQNTICIFQILGLLPLPVTELARLVLGGELHHQSSCSVVRGLVKFFFLFQAAIFSLVRCFCCMQINRSTTHTWIIRHLKCIGAALQHNTAAYVLHLNGHNVHWIIHGLVCTYTPIARVQTHTRVCKLCKMNVQVSLLLRSFFSRARGTNWWIR